MKFVSFPDDEKYPPDENYAWRNKVTYEVKCIAYGCFMDIERDESNDLYTLNMALHLQRIEELSRSVIHCETGNIYLLFEKYF